MKWAVSLVFAYGHFNIPLGVSEYTWINILTYDPGGWKDYSEGTREQSKH